MKYFDDEKFILFKTLSNQIVVALKPALDKVKKRCENLITEIELIDKSLEQSNSAGEVNKLSKISQLKRDELLQILAIKNRIDMFFKRNSERIAFIDNILKDEGVYKQEFDKKKIAEIEKEEMSNIDEDSLNLNLCKEGDVSYEKVFFDGVILELKDGKLDFSNENNAKILTLISDELLTKIIRIYPESISTISVEILLNTSIKKKILKNIAIFVDDESKKKDIKQINKRLGNLLEFKSEITKTNEDYIAGVSNMFNSMIKAHLIAKMPEKTTQINEKLKCNEKSELIPATKRVAIMSAGLAGDVRPEHEESEEERIAREKELNENSINELFANFMEQLMEQEDLNKEYQDEEAERLSEAEKENIEQQKKLKEIEEQEKEIEEELAKALSKNKYDD